MKDQAFLWRLLASVLALIAVPSVTQAMLSRYEQQNTATQLSDNVAASQWFVWVVDNQDLLIIAVVALVLLVIWIDPLYRLLRQSEEK